MLRTAPAIAAAASTVIIPSFSRNTAITASAVKSAAAQSIDASRGSSTVSGPARQTATASKITWMANQIARFRITPTTAAVTAVSAAPSARLRRSRSIHGAPSRIHAKHGAKVT